MPPVAITKTFLDRTCKIVYDQLLNEDSPPLLSDYVINLGATPFTITSINVVNNTVYIGTLEHGSPGLVSIGAFTPGRLKNMAGELAPAINGEQIQNLTAATDTTIPLPTLGRINAANVFLYFDEILDSASIPAASSFWITVNGTTVPAVDPVVISGVRVQVPLAVASNAGNVGGLTYTPPGSGNLRDFAPNNVPAIFPAILLVNTLTSASGYYSDQLDLERFYGVDNIRKWSQLDGGTTADLTRIVTYLAYGDRYVNRKLRENGYDAPLSTSSDDFDLFSDAHTELVGAWVYMARGTMDVLDKSHKALRDQMAAHEKNAIHQLRSLIMRGIDGTKRAFSSGFAAVAPAEYPSVFIPSSFTWPYNR